MPPFSQFWAPEGTAQQKRQGVPMTPTAHLPLAGIRVVDLTSNIAAPFAGAVLGDLGAGVVHVESRTGDDSRGMAPRVGDTSAYWQVVNRNKRVLSMDIRRRRPPGPR